MLIFPRRSANINLQSETSFFNNDITLSLSISSIDRNRRRNFLWDKEQWKTRHIKESVQFVSLGACPNRKSLSQRYGITEQDTKERQDSVSPLTLSRLGKYRQRMTLARIKKVKILFKRNSYTFIIYLLQMQVNKFTRNNLFTSINCYDSALCRDAENILYDTQVKLYHFRETC